MSGFFKSSIGRKIAMALSAFFLMFFLIIHLAVNLTSLFSEELFNELSHFMGTNPLVQFALQPVLIAGVVFHFVMGFVLEIQNRKARVVSYAKNNGGANSTWMSRNMIVSGAVILAFLGLHFSDFWVHEITVKYINVQPEDPTRYYHELVEKFVPLWRTALYCLAFVLLALHLLHGFNSAFQSVGLSGGRKGAMKKFGTIYSIVIPLGFIVIALVHHLNH